MFKIGGIILLTAALSLGWVPTGIASDNTSEIILMAHDSFSVSKTVVAEFENRHHVRLRFLKAGDTGAMLNQAILSKNNPMADVLFGVDNTFLSRALAADMFIPYPSPHLGDIPDELKLDPTYRLLPVDYGDVCLNYDRNGSPPRALRLPPGWRI